MKTEKVTIEVTNKKAIELLKKIMEVKTAFKEHIKKTGTSENFDKKVSLPN